MLLEFLGLLEGLFDFLFEILDRRIQLFSQGSNAVGIGSGLLSCDEAGSGFDAAYAGGNGRFGGDAERPISPVARVCVPPHSSME